MMDGSLTVEDMQRPRGQHIAIDAFYRTLAEAQWERALAILLSGAGGDGAVGIGRVKEKGGVVLERRMQVRFMPSLPEYQRLLEADAGEHKMLLNDLLISIVADVTPARPRQHFTRDDNRCHIRKAVRDRILFADGGRAADRDYSRPVAAPAP
jgi:hypothetical protein